METVSLAIINLRTDKEKAAVAGQVYLNKNPVFQRAYEAWDEKLRTRFIESILLGRATNPIWTVLNEEDDSEEILDGMHRVTTGLEYFNNTFSINKNYLLDLDSEKYNKKKYSDLDIDDKAKIRNYCFIFNKLDSSYRKDLNKLKNMYEILNRSSKTLNDYEFNKVLLNPFYDIVKKNKEAFIKTPFFNRITKDSRGNIDTEIIEMLVLTNELPNTWSSVNNLKEQWITSTFGDTSESINNYIKNHGVDLENKLKLLTKIIVDFYEIEFFSNDARTFKKNYLPYKFVASRCCFLIKNYSLFNRVSKNITKNIKEKLMYDDIQKVLNCNSRNAIFQRNLIQKIDEIIKSEINIDNRFFSDSDKKDKLKEQNWICPLCNKKIKETDRYEGDHIVSWTAGGETNSQNLQVLHKRCHQLKNTVP